MRGTYPIDQIDQDKNRKINEIRFGAALRSRLFIVPASLTR